jgi:uncharacterized protein (DUF1330 family)
MSEDKEASVRISRELVPTALVGILLGVALAHAIRAQDPEAPPAYIIAEVEKPQDPAALRRYADEVPKTLLPFNGRYIVRGGPVEALEGDKPKGAIVILGFDSLEKARGWYSSPGYSAIRPIRQSATRSRLLLVQGVAPK